MTKPKFIASISLEALDHLTILGENIRMARRARGWSLDNAAGRFLMSKATLQAVERGDPATAMGAYLSALDVMGIAGGIDSIGASHKDPISRRAL